MSASTGMTRWARGVELGPVLAALGLYAVAHGRWLLAAPVGLGLVVAAVAGFSLERSSVRLVAAGVLGGGAGLLLLALSPPPVGPIPPAVLSPLCGAVVGLCASCALSAQRLYTWTYAGLLAALSLHVTTTLAVSVAFSVLLLSLLLAIFLHEGLERLGAAGALGFGAFSLVLGGVAWGIASGVSAGEGMLMGVVYRMLNEAGLPSAPPLQQEVGLATRSSVPLSGRLLLELEGEVPRRLRTTVLERFDGSRWVVQPRPGAVSLRLPKGTEGETLRAFELTFLEPLGGMLPSPAGTREVEGAVPQVLPGEVLSAGVRSGETVRMRSDAAGRLTPEPPPEALLTELTEALKAELLPLAESLTRDAETPRAKAETLEAFFRESFEYSLKTDLSGEGSPLAVMIRERRPAYCIYFASAMAALLRAQGVPARLVGGFVSEERNPLTGTVLVRERDAHAWVEAYLEDEGRFVAFDPTPWRSRDDALELDDGRGPLAVLGQALASVVRRTVAAVRKDPAAAGMKVLSSPVSWGVLVGFAVWRWRKRGARTRGVAARGALGTADAEVAAAYRRYLRLLRRRAGLVPAASETDEELLVRLRSARGEPVARLAEAFLVGYRQARYRHGNLGGVPLGEHLARLEAALREGA